MGLGCILFIKQPGCQTHQLLSIVTLIKILIKYTVTNLKIFIIRCQFDIMQGPSSVLSIIIIIAGISLIGVVVYQILPLLRPKAKTNWVIILINKLHLWNFFIICWVQYCTNQPPVQCKTPGGPLSSCLLAIKLRPSVFNFIIIY